MVHANKTITFVGLDFVKLGLLLLGSLIIVLVWNFLSFLVVVGTFIYMAYRFSRLALGGFSCAHCYFHFIISIFLFIFSFGALGSGSVIIPLLFLWISGLTKGV